MISERATSADAFVWVWLPGATEPVVAGRLVTRDEGVRFAYGRFYLSLSEARSLYEPELPSRAGLLPLSTRLSPWSGKCTQ